MADFNYSLLDAFPELYSATFSAHPQEPPQGFKRLIFPTQVHGDQLQLITNPEAFLPPCDAIATAEQGIALMIRHADCQAALVYDPRNRVVAAIHAGWRGLVQEIYPKTLAALHREFGCRPEELKIAISPSLGPENGEFIHYKEEFPLSFWRHQASPNHFDLRAIAQEQLYLAGILPQNLQISQINTYLSQNGCPSYRRDKTTMRMGSVIGLNP